MNSLFDLHPGSYRHRDLLREAERMRLAAIAAQAATLPRTTPRTSDRPVTRPAVGAGA
jgi:hypothetical protein